METKDSQVVVIVSSLVSSPSPRQDRWRAVFTTIKSNNFNQVCTPNLNKCKEANQSEQSKQEVRAICQWYLWCQIWWLSAKLERGGVARAKSRQVRPEGRCRLVQGGTIIKTTFTFDKQNKQKWTNKIRVNLVSYINLFIKWMPP